MNLLRVLLITALVALVASPAWSQVATNDTQQPQNSTTQPRIGHAAPLVFWNRPITVFRSYYEQMSPAERATKAAERLEALPEVASDWKIVANPSASGQYSGTIITVNGTFAFGILSGDLDPESGETLTAATDSAVRELRGALDARSQQYRLPVLLRGMVLTVVASLLLLVGLWLIVRGGNRALVRIELASKAQKLKVGGLDLQPLLRTINRALVKLTMWALAVTLVYLWLTFVLLRFPYSQPWGHHLGSFLLNLFARLGSGFLRAIPGIFTVTVIFLITRIVARVIDGIFQEFEKGDIELPWLHRDTGRATRRVVVVLIWIFAITVAYPYIPGSSSDAFKGVSVFVGLMVSLGSAGLVNQVMSGLVVIYSRALTVGEFVRVGEDFGTVSEVGMLSTKILTRKLEEITIPNSVMVSTKTTNYSRQAGDVGAVVGTTVTIGYDAPWRLVHQMLLQAAAQTPGVRRDPEPRVMQKSLADFYVEYELVFNLDEPSERVPVLSELHKHIQDAFNEHGVQIMSPHFETQPDEKVFVPKSKWFASSAPESAEETNGDQHSQANR